MKTTFRLAAGLVMAAVCSFTLASCDNEIKAIPGAEGEDQTQGSKKAELSLSGKTTELTTSKAGEGLLPVGTGIGVFVVDNTSGETLPAASVANVSHTVNETGRLGLVGSGSSPITLNMGFRYDVYGYVPYKAGVTGSTVTALPVAHGVDFMWAKAEGEVPNTVVHSTELIFGHKTAQITFKVVADAASKPNINGATLEVTGFYGTGTVDLTTGTIIPGGIDNTIALTEAEQSICFIAPEIGQKLALDVVVTVPQPNVGAGIYRGTMEVDFKPGMAYEYTVTVTNNQSDLMLSGYEVGWVDQTGTIEVGQ